MSRKPAKKSLQIQYFAFKSIVYKREPAHVRSSAFQAKDAQG